MTNPSERLDRRIDNVPPTTTRSFSLSKLGAVALTVTTALAGCKDAFIGPNGEANNNKSDSTAPATDNGVADKGVLVDTAVSKDAGLADQGTTEVDMGNPDSGVITDVGPSADASPVVDAAPMGDVLVMPEAGIPPDAAPVADAHLAPDVLLECVDVEVAHCYGAAEATENVGVCRAGVTERRCPSDDGVGVSVECTDDVTPVNERYGDLRDNNCNGQVDEANGRLQSRCEPGVTTRADGAEYVCAGQEWRTTPNGAEISNVPQLFNDAAGNAFAVLRVRVPAGVNLEVRALNGSVVPPAEVTSRAVPCDTPQVDASFPVNGGDTAQCYSAPALGDGFNFPGARITFVVSPQ